MISKLFAIISNKLWDWSLYFGHRYNRWVLASQQNALGPCKWMRFWAKQTYRVYIGIIVFAICWSLPAFKSPSHEKSIFLKIRSFFFFKYFETSFMSAKKEFLARFLREKSGWSKLWKRFYICCLVAISQKRKGGKHEEGIYPLFWCFSCLSLELTQMIFFLQKIPFLGQLGSHHAC